MRLIIHYNTCNKYYDKVGIVELKPTDDNY